MNDKKNDRLRRFVICLMLITGFFLTAWLVNNVPTPATAFVALNGNSDIMKWAGCQRGVLIQNSSHIREILIMARIRYSQDTKQQAVRLVLEEHFTLADATKQSGDMVFSNPSH
ncbi:MAG: hypothetical protein Q4G68_06855 [Planctomycetia bacterium]|nr:hypothetical protein [Planctomycetia bacterium]